MKLGYGTYGMPGLPVLDALAAVKRIGYDGVELCCLPGTPAEPGNLDRRLRSRIRERLLELGLELPALMLSLNAVAADQEEELAKLRAACALALDLATGSAPVLVSTAGGRAGQWESERNRVADSIGAYVRLVGERGLVLALEPHVGGVVHRPEQAEWVRRHVGSEALAFNYDESHFQLQGLCLEESAWTMVPHAAATHLKDACGDARNVTFLLPGEGDFDYPRFFRLLHSLGYDGYLTVEVSGMVWGADGYDAAAGARFAYRTLERGLVDAGLRTPPTP